MSTWSGKLAGFAFTQGSPELAGCLGGNRGGLRGMMERPALGGWGGKVQDAEAWFWLGFVCEVREKKR